MTISPTLASRTPPNIIDIEASGFGRGSYPLEIGLAMSDGARHCFLVAPARSWNHWDPAAEGIHGISREVLIRHGRPVREVARCLNAVLRGETAYSDAWSFDMPWLGRLFDTAGLPQTFRIGAITELMNERQFERWDAVKKTVIAETGVRRHRASGDASVLQETWRRLSLPPG